MTHHQSHVIHIQILANVKSSQKNEKHVVLVSANQIALKWLVSLSTRFLKLMMFYKCYEPSVTSKSTVACQMYVTWMSRDFNTAILFNLGCCWHVSEESNIYCFKSVFSTIENQISNSTNRIAEKFTENSEFESDNRPSPRSEMISLDLEPVRSQSSVDIIEEVILSSIDSLAQHRERPFSSVVYRGNS